MKTVIGLLEVQRRLDRLMKSHALLSLLSPALRLAPARALPRPVAIRRSHAPDFSTRARLFTVSAVAVVLFAATSSQAAVKVSNGSGAWGTSATWNPSGQPASTDDVIIRPGDTVTVNSSASVHSITFSNTTSTAGIVSVSSGQTLTVSAGVTNQNAAAANTAATLTGLGTLTCASLTVGGTTVPTAVGTNTFTASISTLTISGSLAVIGQNSAANNNSVFALASGSASVAGSVAFTAPAGSSAAVDLTQGAQTGTLTLSGATPFTGTGTFLASGTGATVNYSGAAQTVNPVTYQNLTLSGSGVKTLTGVSTVNGVFSLSGSVSATLATNLIVGSDLDIASGTTLDVSTGNFSLSVGGNWSNSGTFTARAGTVTLNGTAAESIGGSTTTTFSSLTIGNTAATVSSTVSFNVSGTMTINAGAVFSPAAANVINSSAAAGTLTGSGVIMASRTSSTADLVNQYKFITYSLSALTVNYSGAGSQTVNSTVGSYGGLIISGSGTKTLAGAIVDDGGVTLSAGTLAAGANNLSVGGDWLDNTGSFTTSGSETVTFNGSVPQNLGGSAATTFINLVINNAAGVNMNASATLSGTLTLTSGTLAVGANTLSLNGPAIAGTPANLSTTSASTLSFGGSSTGVSVPSSITALNGLTINNANGVSLNSSPVLSGTLTLTAGNLVTGANAIGLAAAGSISGASSSHYVNGNVQKTFNTGSGQSFTYPIGDGSAYTPVALASMTVSSAGSLTAGVTAGDHPQIASSGLNSAQSVNRYWTLTSDGIMAASTYSATFNFVSGDLDAGATTANFLVRRYNGGWSPTTIGTRASTSSQAVGLNAFGDFAIADNMTDHYAVSAASPSTGVAFVTTATAQDIFNQTVTADSTTVVTMTATGNAQFDHDGNGIYGDNTMTLTNGAAGILTRDLNEETVTLTATDPNGRTGSTTLALTAAAGAYRSVASGNWNSAATWQTNNGSGWVSATTFPTSANAGAVFIQSNTVVTVTANVTNDQTIIQPGGQVTVNSGITLTIASGPGIDFDVFGTLQNAETITTTGSLVFQAGSQYEHNLTTTAGTIPTATWDPNSTCSIIGYTSNTSTPGGLSQNFGYFTWNCPNQTGTIIMETGDITQTISGDFTVVSTGTGTLVAVGGGDSLTLTINGNLKIQGGIFIFSNGTSSGAGPFNLNLLGSYNQTGGTFNHTSSRADLGFNFAGTNETFTQSAGTLTTTAMNFSVNSGSSVTLNNNLPVASGQAFTVAGTLNCGTSAVTGAGAFTLSSGGTLGIGSTAGLSSTAGTGNLQVTGSRSLSTSANYAYNGGAAQAGGNALPTTVNNLTINNPTGVTLGVGPTVNGTLVLSNGVLATAANQVIIASAGTVSGAGSAAYVDGSVQKAFGSTGTGQSFTFPIGDASNYLPLSLSSMNVTHTGNVTAKTVAGDHPAIASSLIDSTLSVNRYWTITNGGSLAANYSATFNYAPGDLDASANPATFLIQTLTNATNWATATLSGTPGTTSASISGQTLFGDFAIGDPKGNQTITFPSVGNQTYGVGPITLGATASSGLPVNYSVTGPATLSGGTLTITGASSVTITASQAGNVDWNAATNVSQTITVSKLAITGNITASDKVYDATTTATIATRTLSGVVGNDTVSLTGGTATFSDKTAATNKTVVATGLSLTGASATNYVLASTSATNTASITAKTLTITGTTAANKVYDGGTAATIATNSSALSGVISGDSVTLVKTGAIGAFADKTVGTAKPVTVSGFTITGTDSANYSLTQPTATANITALGLTITGLIGNNKVYDRTTNATLSGTAALSGVVNGDNVTLGGTPVAGFATKTVANGKAVTVTGYTISGTDSGNYTVSQPTGLTANITALGVTVINVTANNKVYDRTTNATLSGTAALSGVISGDTVNLGGTVVAGFADKLVATGKLVTVSGYTISGTDSGNYTVSQPSGLTANITAKGLTVTGITGVNRVYDDATDASLSGTAALSGVVSGDSVTVGGTPLAVFADKLVANSKPLTVTGFTISGADAANYTLTQPTPAANITALGLTVTGIAVNNKVYDRTTIATLDGTASLSGVLGSDVVNLGGAAMALFSSKTVANGKTVTISGYTISGADSGNYSLSQPTGLTANITAAGLTIGGVTANNKVYDRTSNATLTGTAALSGVISGDSVNLGGTPVAGFADKLVATGKPVTVNGYTISGSDSGNYTVSQPAGLTANITAKGLTVTGITGVNRVYDGTTNSTLGGSGSLVGVVSGDVVTLDSTAATAGFASKTVGTGKTVTLSGLAITGADAGNYSLTQPTTTANITALALTVSGITASDKVYDGTQAAVLNAGGAALVGVVSGDVVNLGGAAVGTFVDKNAGAGKTVNVSGLTISGSDSGNYTVTQPATTASITAKGLTVTGITANNKVYDGGTTATLSGNGSLVGVVGGDTVTLGGTAIGTFADKNVANGITVTVSGLTLGGASAGNYSLTQPVLAANITVAGLTVTGITVNAKVYDGGTSAVLNTGAAALVGVSSGDVVTLNVGGASGVFADKTVGVAKTVTVSGLAIGGLNAGDYSLSQPTVTGNITALGLTVNGVTAADKVYDGTNTAMLNLTNATLVTVLGSDVVALDTSAATGTFSDKTADTNKTVTVSGLAINGADAGNYSVTQPTTTASITPLGLTVSGITASDKVYDGTTNATVDPSAAALVTVVSGDDVSLDATSITGAFADKNVAAGKTVNVTGLVINGLDSTNYSLTQPATTASITPAPVTGSITVSDKVYDGTTAAVIASSTPAGVISPDVVTVTGGNAAFADKNVGLGKTVVASGLVLGGDDAGNYSLVSDGATNTANITSRTLTVTATGVTKIYDGTTAASVTLADDRVANDVLTASAIAVFVDPNVGPAKPINVSGITISGTDSGNYVLASTTASASADITPAVLTVQPDNVSRNFGTNNPVFTAGYSGFVNSEGTNVLSGSPLLSTTADTFSPVGTYLITATNGSLTAANYTFAFATGTLTITPAGVLFSDDFTRDSDPLPLTAPWSVESGAWSVTGGMLVGGPNAPQTYGFAYVETNWTDYSVQGTVQFSTTDAFGGGIGGRLNPATGAHYAAWIYPDTSTSFRGGNILALIKFQDWSDWGYQGTPFEPIVQVALPAVGTGPHLLTLAFRGNQIAVSLDSNQMINATDAEAQPYLGGGITVDSWTDSIQFNMSVDNILVVSPLAQDVSFAALADQTYGTAPFALTATASSGLPVNFSVVSGPATISSNLITLTGTGLVTVRASQPGDAAYNAAADVDQSFNVNPATLSVTADNQTGVYGSPITTLTGELVGVVNNDSITASFTTLATTGSPVGQYVITAGLNDPNLALTNYTVTTNNGALTIGPAALSVVPDNQTSVYGSAIPALTGTLSGVVNNDNITATYLTSADTNSGVGGYAIEPLLNDPNLALTNYTVSATNGVLTVNPAGLTITADNQGRAYGAANPVLTASYHGFVNGDTTNALSVVSVLGTLADTNSPVGAYPITVGGAAAANYLISYVPGTLNVGPAELLVSANNASRAYGATNPVFTASYTGFVNGESNGVLSGSPLLSTLADTNSPVGTYPIEAAQGTLSNANYSFTFTNGTLTVTPYALSVTADNQTAVYGSTLPVLTGELNGLVNADNITAGYATVATNGSGVGQYAITITLNDPNLVLSNYSVSQTNGTLTINPAALSLTADNQTSVYGSAIPALTGELVGVVNNDSITASYSTVATAGSGVGQYAITAGLNDPNSALTNYTVTTNNGILTIGAAALSVTADNQTSLYGSAIPTLTGELVGVVNNDSITASYSTVATTGSPVGQYVITAGLDDPNSALTNYTVTTNNGTLTITPAALSITADNQTNVYGSALPTLTGELVGVVNNDNITANYTTVATNGSGVGPYAINAGLNDPNSALTNYTVSATNGVLTVNPAGLTITADNQGRAYGAANPVLTASYHGFVNGDTTNVLSTIPVLSTLADTNSPVGAYPITVGGAAAANYLISYVPGTLNVGPAELLVSANDASRAYGATNPVFTASYTGFVNGESNGVLSGSPLLSTLADTNSPVGTYPIEAAQGTLSNANYSFTFTNGTLTVTPYALSVTADNQASIYGSAIPALTGVLAGVTNGDTITASYVTVATNGSGVGQYAITITLNDPNLVLSNYSVSQTNGTLTISPAALSLTADNQTSVYGSAIPSLTGELTGIVHGDNLTASYATVATAGSGVGQYAITTSLNDPNSALTNYLVTTNNGTLTITPAALSVTADNQTSVYGAAIPTLTGELVGVVNSDTITANYTTLATTGSGVGQYAITADLNDPNLALTNYTVTTNNGTLTVISATSSLALITSANPALPGAAVTFTATLNAVAPGSGIPTGVVQFDVDGSPAGVPVSLVNGIATLTTTSLTHGSHSVKAEYAGDANFIGASNSLGASQVINTPPATSILVIATTENTPVTFSIAKVLQHVTDADGDQVNLTGVAGVSANGGTIALGGQSITFTPVTGSTNTDSFTYTVTDALGAAATGVVSVVITAPPAVPPSGPVTMLPNGHVIVTLSGVAGQTYILQGSPDLQTWVSLCTVVAAADGTITVEDGDAPDFTVRYYKLALP